MSVSRLDLAIVAAFALSACAYVVAFHFPAPYFDHWDIVPLLEAAESGTLRPGDLFAIHGGHWHAAAYAIMIPLAHLTHWSHLAEALASLVFLVAAFALLSDMGLRFAREAAPHAGGGPFLIAAALIVFSLDQSSNLLWPFQLCVFTALCGVALCLNALTRSHLTLRSAFAAHAGLALAVTSYATGFALIPLGFVLIALNAAPARTRLAHGAIWLAVSVAWCVAFLAAQRAAPHGGGFDSADLTDPGFPLYLAQFELTYLGAALARQATALIAPLAIAGPVIAAACAWLLVKRGAPARVVAAPLALCLFSIGAGLLCGLGRFDFGAGQGGNGRYVTFSGLFWLGAGWLALAALSSVQAKAWRRGAVVALAVLALLKVSGAAGAAAKNVRVTGDVVAAAEAMRADPANAAEAARAIAWERQDIERHTAFIARKHWSVLR